MKSVWRTHLIMCVVLALLAIPIYFLDRALLAGGGGGNWIALDFRGVVFWSYIALLAVDVTLSSIAALGIPKAGLLRIHLGSMLFAMLLLIAGVAVYGKLRRAAMSNEYRTMMANRRPLMNAIELKNWWYVPDESHPTEIRVSVVVHQQGRFAGNVSGEQTDAAGISTPVFESANEPDRSLFLRSATASISANKVRGHSSFCRGQQSSSQRRSRS